MSVKRGAAAGDIYGALKNEIDAARDQFMHTFLRGPPRWSITSIWRFCAASPMRTTVCWGGIIRGPWFEKASQNRVDSAVGRRRLGGRTDAVGTGAGNQCLQRPGFHRRHFPSARRPKRHGAVRLCDLSSGLFGSSDGDVDGALALLTAWRANPIDSSPLLGKIDLLYARTLLDKRDPALSAKALSALQTDYKLLPQPDGDFALGLAFEALGEQPQAALSYEKAFYSYPMPTLRHRLRQRSNGCVVLSAKTSPRPPRASSWIAATSGWMRNSTSKRGRNIRPLPRPCPARRKTKRRSASARATIWPATSIRLSAT